MSMKGLLRAPCSSHLHIRRPITASRGRGWLGVRLLTVAVLLGSLLPGIVSSRAASAAGAAVSMVDDAFSPQSLTIPVGTTVTWTNTGTSPHTATCKSGCGPATFDSGNVNPGGTASNTFTVAGTYKYVCLYHTSSGMTGTITVTAPTSTPTNTPVPPTNTPVPAATSTATSAPVAAVTNTPSSGGNNNTPQASQQPTATTTPMPATSTPLPTNTPTTAPTSTPTTPPTNTPTTPPTNTPTGSASHPAGVTDTISGYKYSPDPVKVQVGGTITWINQDADPHTATSDTGANPAFDTGNIASGGGTSTAITFNQVGTFAYHCSYHSGMHGTVEVTAAAVTPVATDTPTPTLTVTTTPTLTPTLAATPTSTLPAVSGGANSVAIVGYAFSPNTLSVPLGATVTWTNQDADAHTATSDTGGVFDSGHLAQGQSYTHTFNQVGSFTYKCTYHANMHGTIVVGGAATPTLSPTPALTLTLTPPALETPVVGGAAAPSTGAVSIVNYVYQPSTLTVAVGAVVTWTNMDVDAHTATSDTPGVFDSGHMAQAGTFSFTFNLPGTFAYHCTYHANMHGTIVVQAAGATAPGLPTPGAVQTAAQLAAPAVAGVSIAPAPALVHDARYFVATGYRVDDDVLFDYYQHRGGLEVFGYPVSREFTFMGCQLQIFQRKAAQACPGQQPEFLNLLDPEFPPLTNVNGSTFPAPDPALKSITPSVNDPDYAAKIIDFVRANAPDTFEGEPVNFGQTFFGSITADMVVPEALGTLDLLNLEVWGAPISQPQRDPNNSKFIYQRFQRGIMHYDATTGATRGILLADYFKQILLDSPNLPPDVRQESVSSPFLKQYCPGSAGWLCRPDDLPATDLTYGFAVDPSIMAVGGVPVAAPANGSSVNIVDFSFDPASLSVATGTTVRWTNRGRLPHNVTDSGGEWHSDLLRTGQSFEHRFDTPGTYTYVCSVHPGMEATLVVTGDAVSAAPAPPAPAAPASAGGGAAAPATDAPAPAAAAAPAANAPAPAAAAAPAANASASAAAPAANAGAAAAPSSASVAIVNFAYQPSPLTVPVGATVTWTNQDTDPHTATSDTAGVFDSGLMPKDKTFSFTFSQAGTFTYKCTYHSNMHGTIVVQSS